MDEIYVDMRIQNRWIQKYFPNKDFVSIDELIGCIEDLDSEIDHLKEELEDATKSEEEKLEDWKWTQADIMYEEQRLKEMEDK